MNIQHWFRLEDRLNKAEADYTVLLESFWISKEAITMHMADALLSPAVGEQCGQDHWYNYLTAQKNWGKKMDDKLIPLMGVLGAFIFAGQMINFTIPMTGSSGHNRRRDASCDSPWPLRTFLVLCIGSYHTGPVSLLTVALARSEANIWTPGSSH